MGKSKTSKTSEDNSLIEYLIARRTFGVSIGLVLCLALGIAAWIKMPLEVMPRGNVQPFLYLRVDGKEKQSPEKVEGAVTLAVEGVVRTLPNLAKFTSATDGRGVSVSLAYRAKTNIEIALFTLQEALQELESRGIIDLKSVNISRFNPDAAAVMKLSITQNGNMTDPVRLIRDDLRIGLESIPEVSKVELVGLEPLVYHYAVDSTKLGEIGLRAAELSSALRFQSIREPVGEILIGDTGRVTGVKTRMITSDLDEVRNQILTSGGTMTLGRLATESIIDKAKDEFLRKNGESAVLLEIFSKDSANIFDLNNHIRRYLSAVKADRSELSSLEFEFIFNKTDDLRTALDDVFEALYQSMLITFVIVLLFLRKWRETLLIAMSIPVTLLITVLFMHWQGITLNILTLSGLILGIGMVVDNSILVVGRIQELIASNLTRKMAAARGASEVAMALIMSTVTNAIIFLPAVFIDGGDSFTDLLKAFQVPILATLAASLVVALLFIPVVQIHWVPKKQKSTVSDGKPNDEIDPALSGIVARFRFIQKYKYPFALLVVVVVGWLSEQIVNIRESDLEDPRDPFTTINVKFSPEITETIRKSSFGDLEKTLMSQQSDLGFKFMVSDFNPTFLSGSFQIYPLSSGNPDETLTELERKLKEYVGRIATSPGIEISIGWGGVVLSRRQQSQKFEFSGPKMARLLVILDELKPKLSAVPEVDRVSTDREERGQRTIIFVPNDRILAQYNLNLAKIALEISASMSSVGISNLSYNGKTVAAKISLTAAHGDWGVKALEQMRILVSRDRYVNLMDLGHLEAGSEIRSINRAQGTATGKVYVYFKEALSQVDASRARYQIRRILDEYTFPLGYGFAKNESDQRIDEMKSKNNFIILLSALLIYLVLASMFESILIPFAVLFCVPIAIIFGVAGLYFLGMELDVMARLSLVILVGTGVNNAIILLDLITTLQKKGFRRDDAIAMGCAKRLNAVLMSTAIQVIGVLPVALGKAKIMGIPYASLGVSIIFGMVFSTIVTLVVLPLVYEILDSFEASVKRAFGIT